VTIPSAELEELTERSTLLDGGIQRNFTLGEAPPDTPHDTASQDPPGRRVE